MAVLETGSSTSGLADVDSSYRLLVNPSGGSVAIADANGAIIRSVDNRLDVGQDSPLFWDSFDDSAIDSRKWLQYLTTQTAVISSNRLVLNGGAVTTINTNAGVLSHGRWFYMNRAPISCRGLVTTTNLPLTNSTAEFGFGIIASATDRSAPTDGAFFRWRTDGTFECVVSFGGTETRTTVTAPTGSVVHDMEVSLDILAAVFRVDGVVVATITLTGTPSTASARLPVFARVYTAGSAPASAPQLRLGDVVVRQQLLDTNRTHGLFHCGAGHSAAWSPVTPYATANGSTNGLVLPAGAAQSNTTAPISTLGGRVNLNAMAGADLAAPVDALIFAYQVPTGQRFVCTGVLVSVQNLGAAVATTPTTLEFSLGTGATAASLATADSFTASPQPTFAPRKVYLGMASLPVGAVVGALAGDFVRDFSAAPIVCEGGKFIAGIMRCTVGTATASQTLRIVMQPYGFFE